MTCTPEALDEYEYLVANLTFWHGSSSKRPARVGLCIEVEADHDQNAVLSRAAMAQGFQSRRTARSLIVEVCPDEAFGLSANTPVVEQMPAVDALAAAAKQLQN